ncbi:MAG: radical SAM/SPASM domain-containing protein, partial [Acidobacteriota bacterium]
MESLYYVMSWLCHRTCEHCYEDRFRPYRGADLAGVVAESVANMPRIIDHLPARMTYLDRRDPDGAGGYREKPGSVILAGGEILLDPVREAVLYAGIERLQGRYRRRGG